MKQELRKFPRYRIYAAVRFRASDDADVEISSIAKDVPLIGIRLGSYRGVVTGQLVMIALIIPEEPGRREKDVITGRVVWVPENNGEFDIGISLNEEVARSVMRLFIKKIKMHESRHT